MGAANINVEFYLPAFPDPGPAGWSVGGPRVLATSAVPQGWNVVCNGSANPPWGYYVSGMVTVPTNAATGTYTAYYCFPYPGFEPNLGILGSATLTIYAPGTTPPGSPGPGPGPGPCPG